MKEGPGRSCSDCRFWSGPRKTSDPDAMGQCRQRSPQVVMIPAGEPGDGLTGVWPTTKAADWCGEHTWRQS